MQIPILTGIYTDNADFRTSYPVNMVPVPVNTGISAGYLRPAEGAVRLGYGLSLGAPRGAVNWRGKCYAVFGSSLVRINADYSLDVLGNVGNHNDEHVTFTYSFELLAIASNNNLFYWNDDVLVQLVDADLGNVISVEWVDGYFMTTDGDYLVVTDIGNPMSVNPLRYGSSEIDPDPIVQVIKLRNEIHAINRHTIEVFENTGGSTFPFTRIQGAQIQKGACGSHCACILNDSVAFLGGGRNEPPAVYLGSNAIALKISTREIEDILLTYTETELSNAVVSARMHEAHETFWIRLPDRTLVYDLEASKALSSSVWYQLTSATAGFAEYRIVDPVWCYDKWIVFDPSNSDYGYLSKDTSKQFDNIYRWEFGTTIVYNEGRGILFHSIELVCLSGRLEQGDASYVSTSYSTDGMNWSMERLISAGSRGDRMRRLMWLQQGPMRNWRTQRFRGDGKSMIVIARIEAAMEPLAV